MKKISLLFAVIIFFVQPADALFRYHKSGAHYAHHPAQKHLPRYQRIVTGLPFLHLKQPRLHRPGVNPDDQYNITTPGAFSLVCSILALACLAAAGITAFSLLIIPVFVFATLGAVFGAIGIKRYKPGYAIAGLVLGILAMVGGFMVSALVL